MHTTTFPDTEKERIAVLLYLGGSVLVITTLHVLIFQALDQCLVGYLIRNAGVDITFIGAA